MVAMATAFKESQKFYQKFIFGMKANFYAKFEEILKTWTYHQFFILHESYVNLYLSVLSYRIIHKRLDVEVKNSNVMWNCVLKKRYQAHDNVVTS